MKLKITNRQGLINQFKNEQVSTNQTILDHNKIVKKLEKDIIRSMDSEMSCISEVYIIAYKEFNDGTEGESYCIFQLEDYHRDFDTDEIEITYLYNDVISG
jgi:hypothetical protein